MKRKEAKTSQLLENALKLLEQEKDEAMALKKEIEQEKQENERLRNLLDSADVTADENKAQAARLSHENSELREQIGTLQKRFELNPTESVCVKLQVAPHVSIRIHRHPPVHKPICINKAARCSFF